ncbi:MAG: transposase, partial [Cyanobacteria bacterium REEB446]|nr:transposase [Cyanobacteria bacterium REEB446]
QAVDMKHGMITGIDVSPANLTDAQLGVKVLPPSGMVFADKGYDTTDFLYSLINKLLNLISCKLNT